MDSSKVFDGPIGMITATLMARGNRAAEAEAVDQLAPKPDDHVLAVGFGPGIGVELLAGLVTSGQVAGIDPSAVMVRKAERRARRIGADRLDLRRGRCDDLPWEDEVFDGVITVNTVQLWDPFDRSVAEVARVLRPGGRFVSYTHDWALGDGWTDRASETFTRFGFSETKSWRGDAKRIVAFTATKATKAQ